MRIGNLFYRLFIDDKGLKQDAAKSGKVAGKAAGDEAGKGLTASLKGAFKGGELKKGLIQGLGLGAGLGGLSAVTAGVGALTDAIGASIDAASDQREAMSLTGQVFEENTKQIEDWAESASEGFGQSKTEALEFASNFGTAFKNVGFALDEASEKSKTMTELAADLGSAFNAGADEAALALRSGLLGESEPLRRFGVFLDEAKVKAKAVQLGIAKLGDVLSDNQKVTARYALIMEQTADSQGMFGRDSESLADAQKSLQAEIENVSAEIGDELLPIITDFVNFVRDEVVPILGKFTDALDATGDAAMDNQEPIQNLANILHDLFKDEDEPARTFLGSLFDGLNDVAEASNNLGRNINDAVIFWDGYTDAAEDSRIENERLSESAREAARGLAVVEVAADDATTPIVELGDAGTDTAKKLKRAADQSGESFEDFRDRVLGYARDVVDKAYQIIADKAELTAATIESAELRKVIATGNATKEQKARYTELGGVMAQLVLDLAANGVTAGKEVNTAMNDIRTRLKTATGQERKALLATLQVLKDLAAQAKITAARIKATINAFVASGLGLPSGDRGRAHGGPVTPGRLYEVNENTPNSETVFFPKPGFVLPDSMGDVRRAAVAAVAPTSTSGPQQVDASVHLHVAGALPVRTLSDVTTHMRRIDDVNLLPPRTASPRYPVRPVAAE